MKKYIICVFVLTLVVSGNLLAQNCNPNYTPAVNTKVTTPVPDQCFKGNYWTSGACVSTSTQNNTNQDLTGCKNNFVQETDSAIYYQLSGSYNQAGIYQKYCDTSREVSNTDTQNNVNKPQNFNCPKQP